MDQDGPGWTRMDQDGPGWTRMDQDGPDWTRANESERERPRAQQRAGWLASCVPSAIKNAFYLLVKKEYPKRARGGVPRPRWCWRAHDQRPLCSLALARIRPIATSNQNHRNCHRIVPRDTRGTGEVQVTTPPTTSISPSSSSPVVIVVLVFVVVLAVVLVFVLVVVLVVLVSETCIHNNNNNNTS